MLFIHHFLDSMRCREIILPVTLHLQRIIPGLQIMPGILIIDQVFISNISSCNTNCFANPRNGWINRWSSAMNLMIDLVNSKNDYTIQFNDKTGDSEYPRSLFFQ